jgi:phosphate transport system substrate-binding protein
MRKLMTILVLILLPTIVFAADMEILGAGATFPQPLYSKMFDVYNSETGVEVNYQGIGSGGGIRQLMNKIVDFGATDAFMHTKELTKAEGKIVHIPTCLGAVVVTYNLPGNPQLKMTPDIIADIYLGKITKWNDPRIKEVNPEVDLPKMEIVVVHRSDGSGTTFIFSDYLGKVSNQWRTKVGVGKSLEWPTGIGSKGNPGVAGMIKQLPGAIGYVEVTYALSNNMPVAVIRNAAGNFIEPNLESISLAADTKLPDDTRVSLTDTKAENGYPLSSFTWLILFQEQNYNGRDKAKAKATVDLIWWMIHDAQQYAEPLHYAPLPDEAVTKAENILKTVTYNGKALLQK